MRNKGKDEKKRQTGKLHLVGGLLGSADQVNLDGISELPKAVKFNDDDDDEVTMKNNRDKE